MRRLLIALGVSIILIFNILCLPVTASEQQKVVIDLNVDGKYTIYIPSKVEFTKSDFDSKEQYISKPINIAIDANIYAKKELKVKISNENTFKLAQNNDNTIDFSIYNKNFNSKDVNSNKLNKGDYIDIKTKESSSIFERIIINIIEWFFGINLKNGRYGQCYVVIDKNSIHRGGKYNGNLIFEFEVK